MESIDMDYQYRQTLVQFFTGAGWKLFSEMVGNLLLCETSRKEKICQEAVNEEKLQELNFCLGKEKAYSTILALREELLGEEEKENSPIGQA